ncbi:MAG TPA: CBS domain-containing protein [Actinomycetota bacterium]|jgi:CBS-domain-containing membrane protein
MTTNVATVGEGAPFKEIVRVLAERRISALPVLDARGLVVGVVSQADLLHKEEFPEGPDDRWRIEGRQRRAARAKAAGDTAKELMTAPAVTVGPEATVAEAAKLLERHGIKRLPVVDDAGRLVGIASRADLLKVFLRSDQDIRREVLEDVLLHTMWVDPDAFTVEVRDGVVTLAGPLEFRSLIPIAVRLVHGVDGVVNVVDRLWFEVDDARDELRSTMWMDRAPTVRRRV